METQEALRNLNDVLKAEGVPEEERKARVLILKEVIDSAEEMSTQLKAKKQEKKPQAMMPVAKAIEISFFALVIGWMAGIFTLHYYQTQP